MEHLCVEGESHPFACTAVPLQQHVNPGHNLSQAFGQAAANTVGLFLCMLFLGYGLVELPRTLWRRANYEAFLRRCKGLAVSSKENVDKCQSELDKAVANVHLCDALMRDGAHGEQEDISRQRTLRQDLDFVKTLLPKERDAADGGAVHMAAPVAVPVQSGSRRNIFGAIAGTANIKQHYKELGIKRALTELSKEEQHDLVVKLHGKLRDALVD